MVLCYCTAPAKSGEMGDFSQPSVSHSRHTVAAIYLTACASWFAIFHCYHLPFIIHSILICFLWIFGYNTPVLLLCQAFHMWIFFNFFQFRTKKSLTDVISVRGSFKKSIRILTFENTLLYTHWHMFKKETGVMVFEYLNNIKLLHMVYRLFSDIPRPRSLFYILR